MLFLCLLALDVIYQPPTVEATFPPEAHTHTRAHTHTHAHTYTCTHTCAFLIWLYHSPYFNQPLGFDTVRLATWSITAHQDEVPFWYQLLLSLVLTNASFPSFSPVFFLAFHVPFTISFPDSSKKCNVLAQKHVS